MGTPGVCRLPPLFREVAFVGCEALLRRWVEDVAADFVVTVFRSGGTAARGFPHFCFCALSISLARRSRSSAKAGISFSSTATDFRPSSDE